MAGNVADGGETTCTVGVEVKTGLLQPAKAKLAASRIGKRRSACISEIRDLAFKGTGGQAADKVPLQAEEEDHHRHQGDQ